MLDVVSAELSDSERTTLTNMEAAQLSGEGRLEVLSGEDLRQLMRLQGQAQELGLTGNCSADACMAELAGALGAGLVISTQAGKLGDTFVVTLVVFDAAKAKGVARKSIHAASLSELPALLGPALDALVRPLLATPAVAAPTTAPLPARSQRATELLAVEAMQICVDDNDRGLWWFCNRKRGFTENEFVRDYRALTGATDLDEAEQNRSVTPLWMPIASVGLTAAGAGTLAVALGCGAESAPCGADAEKALTEGLGPVVLIVSGTAALSGVIFAIMTTAMHVSGADGIPRQHTLTESEGGGAVLRYNAALERKLVRDFGG
ncbi:MAG: hypothetical protein Q8O67_25005 [Deltaproteobacteria bacterium]|nr:hypothetical protein [Deltaproteobacteria bacterium]